jgi:hypothetical protein
MWGAAMRSRRFRFRTGSLIVITAAAALSLAAIIEACPKCRLGAAALTGSQIAGGVASSHDDPSKQLKLDPLLADLLGDSFEESYLSDSKAAAAAKTPERPSPLSLTGGINFTTAYFHRGYLQEDQGVIAQPYLTAGYTVVRDDDFTITPYVGVWSSFHDEHTFNDGSYDAWYECQLIGGVVFARGPAFIDAQYKLYTYPNGASSQIEEVSVKASADVLQLARRADHPGDVVLLVWAQVAKEISNHNDPAGESVSSAVAPRHSPLLHQGGAAGATADAFDTSGQGTYMELGVEPSFKTRIGKTPVGLAFPVVLGTSLDGYYTQPGGSNDFLGYVSAGVEVTVPLPVPERFGAWYLSGTFTYLDLLADSAKFANYGQEHEFIGTIGISFLH